jgi:hypothetical protein
VSDVDSLIEQYNLAAVHRFAEDEDFRNRVELAADMTRRMVQLMGLTTCPHNHTLVYRRAAGIALFLAEEAS